MSQQQVKDSPIQGVNSEGKWKLKCRKCGHEWLYGGKATRRISCSMCRTSIRIPEYFTPPLPKPINAYLLLRDIDSIKFAKAKTWATSNGEKAITLKMDLSTGFLALPI